MCPLLFLRKVELHNKASRTSLGKVVLFASLAAAPGVVLCRTIKAENVGYT
jgi:hypothetical protein